MSNFSSERIVSLLSGHLVRYRYFAITPRKVNRLGSFFNIKRISSSAPNCTNAYKAFVFVQRFLRNWPGNLAPV